MQKHRVGLFGGTFDPPHRGHLEIVRHVLEADWVDEIIVLPAAVPPHKLNRGVSPATYRLLMAELAFADEEGVSVSPCELQKIEPSYTLHTLEYLQQHLKCEDKELELYFIVGADSLRDFHLWYHPEEILRLAKLLVLNRPGVPQDELFQAAEKWNQLVPGSVIFLEMEDRDYSSTELREIIGNLWQEKGGLPAGAMRDEDLDYSFQEALRHAVMPKVLRFILDQALYGYGNLWAQLSQEENQFLAGLEMVLRKYLRRHRLVHSLNVYLLSLACAHKMGISPMKAAIAGLLHDFAKEFTVEENMAILAADEAGFIPFGCPEPIVHGPIASLLLKERFGIEDNEVAEAIFYHSTLCASPSALTKLLFVVDKVEPGRQYTDLTDIRSALADGRLDLATDLTAKGVASALKRQGVKKDSFLAAYLASREL